MTTKFRKSRLSFVEDLDEEENILADILRFQYCDKEGREINASESGKIFHELGLIYMKRDSSKVCLIQSAALLVAARVRNPDGSSKLIHEDLEKLWRKVLRKADSQNAQGRLETISLDIQQKVGEMRKKARQELNQVSLIGDDFENLSEQKKSMQDKVSSIESIQEKVAHDYFKIMSYLASICINILGESPCKFAFTAMGSLARKEITPYSDFECMIILQEKIHLSSSYQDILEYFRWFSVIFHIAIISLGETILPSLAISSLNNFYEEEGDNWFYDYITPRGISLDGFMPQACKTPLGRQQFTKKKPWKTELIKPLDQMLLYLDLKEDLKNGYHLADMLSQISFVFGDFQLFTEFEDRVHNELCKQRENQEMFFSKLNKAVMEDKINFDSISDIIFLFTGNNFDLKRCFYRSITVFFSALARFYGLTSSCSFQIIKDLKARDLTSEEDAALLSYAVAIGCEIRLKAYQNSNKQNDSFQHLDTDSNIPISLLSLTKMIGEKALVDYFGIAISFQRSIPSFNRQNLGEKLVISDPGLYLVEVSFGLFQHQRAIRYCKQILEKTELKHTEIRTQLYFYLGASLFFVYKANEAKEKFMECIRDDLLRKGESGISFTGNCLDMYSRCILTYHSLAERFREKGFVYLFDNDAFIQLLNSEFQKFENLLSKSQNSQVSPLLLQVMTIQIFVKALRELKLDAEEDLIACSDSFSVD